MSFDYLRNESRAIEFLAGKLREGTLVLVLGAGTSLEANLPDWLTLINRLRARAGLDPMMPPQSADKLQAAADEIKNQFCKGSEIEFAQLVKTCLYEGVSLSSDILKNDLLIALGALMIGSRRGSVKRVLTLNFDSLLEWYLALHGFVPRMITQPPAMEGAEDVRIYHPHGFLPHPTLSYVASDFVILGSHSINRRLGTTGEPWFELMRHLLRTGVCLFVGLSIDSFRDRALAPLLVTVGAELQHSRPTGFWLLRGDGSDEQDREFLSSNVVPIFEIATSRSQSFYCQSAGRQRCNRSLTVSVSYRQQRCMARPMSV